MIARLIKAILPLFFLLILWSPTGAQISLEKLDYPYNSDLYDEGTPIVSLDGKYLYFTRSAYPQFCRVLMDSGVDLSQTLTEDKYIQTLSYIYSLLGEEKKTPPVSSGFNQDILIARLDGDEFAGIEHPCYPLNNALPNSVVSTFLDSNTIVVLNQFYKDGSMYEGFSFQQRLEDGSYNFPQPLHIYDFYSRSADINMALSHDGYVMILSLQREDSKGSNDLYVSFRVKQGLWSAPKNVGRLNTPYQETSPFISKDKRKLYFSSNRPGTLGGNDIFVCERLDYTWTNWTEAQPLMSPINSEYDDGQPFLDDVNSYLYFSSKREGSSDIYRMPLKPKPKLKRPILVKGKILNSETNEPIRSELLWGPETALGYLEYFNTYNGEFEFVLEEFEVYKFFPRKPGYDSQVTRFDARLADKTANAYFEITLYITPIPDDPDPIIASTEEFDRPRAQEETKSEKKSGKKPQIIERQTFIDEFDEVPEVVVEVNEPIILTPDSIMTSSEPQFNRVQKLSFYNIYFVRSKPEVLPESYRALNGLVKTLDDNPSLVILIEGHTDNIGDDVDLVELSWQRAESIKKHLVRYGIDENRIETWGFGASKPLTDNQSEESRKRNRRVEIYSIKEDGTNQNK